MSTRDFAWSLSFCQFPKLSIKESMVSLVINKQVRSQLLDYWTKGGWCQVSKNKICIKILFSAPRTCIGHNSSWKNWNFSQQFFASGAHAEFVMKKKGAFRNRNYRNYLEWGSKMWKRNKSRFIVLKIYIMV